MKTKPFKHQLMVYEKHKESPCYALFWEMGLGKTKVLLDVAAHLHQNGKIQLLLVVAPNSVYKNWVSQEIPKHLDTEHVAIAYPKKNTKRSAAKRKIFLDPTLGNGALKVLCISYDSVRTKRGFTYVTTLVSTHTTMIVADESTAIKTPSAQVTKKMKKIGIECEYRWIATGTPVANSPFDAHSQIEFIDEEYWGYYGLKTINAFKAEFGVYRLMKVGMRQFNQLDHYQKLDTLNKIIAPISSRLLKEDSEVELPPKLYALRTFELTDEQLRVYSELKRSFMAELDEDAFLEAPLAIQRLIRFQQITSGFVKATSWNEGTTDEEEYEQLSLGSIDVDATVEERIIDLVEPDKNPRLKLLQELVDAASHKVIVWCRFTYDVDLVCDTLGNRALRYDGKVKDSLDDFRNPDHHAQVLVANTHAISMGVTLTIAKTMIYYSNDFSLEKRLQSEDRNHRIGQDSAVLIIDLVAEGTVDERIIKCLREKYDVASQVTGDRWRQWI